MAAHNVPESFEAVVLPDGAQKVSVEVDRRVPNTAIIKFEREDHTIGNLLRMQLLLDPSVIFVGYKVPHPLEYHVLLRVQVRGEDGAGGEDGKGNSPVEAVERAMQDLKTEFSLLVEVFNNLLQTRRGTDPGGYSGYT